MIKSVLFLAVFFGSVIYCCKALKPTEAENSEESSEYYSYAKVSEQVRTLSGRTQNIDMINEIIADIMSCEPGRVHKTMRIKIVESGNEYDFLLNGDDDISDLFIEILDAEREHQATSLYSEISKMR